MIVIKLRQAIHAYEERTGEVMTYAELARRTGMARATIEAIGSRPGYNTTLDSIEKLCVVLGCSLEVLLEHIPDNRPKRSSRK